MEKRGLFAPESAEAARERYAAVAPAAAVGASEVGKALDVDRDRVDETVVATAHEAIFASLLEVHVGSREEYEEWLADRDGESAVTELGSENVSGVAWHEAPFDDAVVAATFESEPDAAVHTLRRQAFGRLYREVVA